MGIDPHSVEEEDWLKFDQLALLLGVSPKEIQQAAQNLIRRSGPDGKEFRKVRWVKLKDEVEEEVYREIRKLEIKGVYGNFKHSRLYPNRNLASHLLGFVNKEGIAAMGAESHADYYLKGQDGWRESEKDGERREMPQHRSLEVAARDGLNES